MIHSSNPLNGCGEPVGREEYLAQFADFRRGCWPATVDMKVVRQCVDSFCLFGTASAGAVVHEVFVRDSAQDGLVDERRIGRDVEEKIPVFEASQRGALLPSANGRLWVGDSVVLDVVFNPEHREVGFAEGVIGHFDWRGLKLVAVFLDDARVGEDGVAGVV